MQCWQCGARVRDGAKLCIYCGAKLANDDSRESAASADRAASRDRDYGNRQSSRSSRDDRYGGGWQSSYGETPSESVETPAYPEESEEFPRVDWGQGRQAGASRRDPLDDPRAPRALRSGSYDRDHSYDDERRPPSRPARHDEASGYREPEGDRDRSDGRRGVPREGYGREGRRSASNTRGRGGYDEDYSPRRRDDYPSEGYDMRGQSRDYRGGRERYPEPPVAEDSWNLPALPSTSESEAWAPGGGWNDAQGRMAAPRQGRGAPPATKKRGKRKGSGRAPVIIVLCLVLAAATGGGLIAGPKLLARLVGKTSASGTPVFTTYTPGPTPTPVAKYKEFASTQSHYVLNYPSDWSPSSQNDTSQGQYDYVDTFAKASPYMAVIVEQAQAFDAASDQAILTGEVTGGQKQSLTFTETAPSAGTMLIGGEQWTRKEYDVSGKGQTLHMAILATHHSGHGYAIVLVAQATNFANANSPAFQTVLHTFRFSN